MLPCAKTALWPELLLNISAKYKVPVICNPAVFGRLSFFQELRNRKNDKPYSDAPGIRYVSFNVDGTVLHAGPFRTVEPHAFDEELADAREKLPLWKDFYEQEIKFALEQAILAGRHAHALEDGLARVKLLFEFSRSMAAARDVEDAIHKTMQFIVHKFKLGNISILIHGKQGRHFDIEETAKSAERNLILHMKHTKSPCAVQNVQEDVLFKDMDVSKLPKCMAGFPLISNQEHAGHIITYGDFLPSFDYMTDIISEFMNFITKLYEYQKAQVSAVTDALTGLHNRGNIAKLDLLISDNSFSNLPTSVMMIDADNFKSFNDTKGHPEGDKILRIIAEILKSVIPKEGFVYRYGGEEFLIALPLPSEPAKEIAEKLRTEVEKICPLTISIGIFTCMNSSVSREVMIREADNALYRAKQLGKNKVVARLMVDKLLGIIDS